jgi:hypothetical protein
MVAAIRLVAHHIETRRERLETDLGRKLKRTWSTGSEYLIDTPGRLTKGRRVREVTAVTRQVRNVQ